MRCIELADAPISILFPPNSTTWRVLFAPKGVVEITATWESELSPTCLFKAFTTNFLSFVYKIPVAYISKITKTREKIIEIKLGSCPTDCVATVFTVSVVVTEEACAALASGSGKSGSTSNLSAA